MKRERIGRNGGGWNGMVECRKRLVRERNV